MANCHSTIQSVSQSVSRLGRQAGKARQSVRQAVRQQAVRQAVTQSVSQALFTFRCILLGGCLAAMHYAACLPACLSSHSLSLARSCCLFEIYYGPDEAAVLLLLRISPSCDKMLDTFLNGQSFWLARDCRLLLAPPPQSPLELGLQLAPSLSATF